MTEKYNSTLKFSLTSLWVFGGTFVGSITLLWTFIEPYGGLCKLPFFQNYADCENNISLPYFLLILIALVLAVFVEIIRQMISYRCNLVALIKEVEESEKANLTLFGTIEKDEITNFLTSEQIEKDFTLKHLKLNVRSKIFVDNFFTLCVWLGLYEKDNESYRPKAYLSPFFVKSVYSGISKSVQLFHGVTLHEADAENAKMRILLKKIEELRISYGHATEPIRFINSSIVLIKALDESHMAKFLLQHNTAWRGGYYWWIGGIQELKDKNAIDCAIRELNEELGLRQSNIRHLKFEGVATENTISDRIGVLTNYSYNIFTVTLKDTDKVSQIFKKETSIELPLSGFLVKRHLKWFSWDELRKNEDLKRDAGSILKFIEDKKLYLDSISTEQILK